MHDCYVPLRQNNHGAPLSSHEILARQATCIRWLLPPAAAAAQRTATGIQPCLQRLLRNRASHKRSEMRMALCRATWLPAKTVCRSAQLCRRSMGLGGGTRTMSSSADPGSGPEPSPQQTAAPPPPPAGQQREQPQFRILSEQILHRRYLTLYNRAVQFPADDGSAEVGCRDWCTRAALEIP